MLFQRRDMSTAEFAWKLALCNMFAAFVVTGTFDWLLFNSGQKTISQFLREQPGWFWCPAFGMSLWLAFLAIHLYWKH